MVYIVIFVSSFIAGWVFGYIAGGDNVIKKWKEFMEEKENQ